MDCPSCKTHPLRPAIIEEGLPGYTCKNCRGVLFDILAYRMWVQKKPDASTSTVIGTEPAADSREAVLCPKCTRIMMKYHISGEVENRLDLCSYCGELWLDSGEWHLLDQLGLLSGIPQILSEPWQKSVRMEQVEQSIENKFENLLGTEDYRKIKAFKEWMVSQENVAHIKDYLNRDSAKR
jgi:Zn-finger nucleic acid-binding protein